MSKDAELSRQLKTMMEKAMDNLEVNTKRFRPSQAHKPLSKMWTDLCYIETK